MAQDELLNIIQRHAQTSSGSSSGGGSGAEKQPSGSDDGLLRIIQRHAQSPAAAEAPSPVAALPRLDGAQRQLYRETLEEQRRRQAREAERRSYAAQRQQADREFMSQVLRERADEQERRATGLSLNAGTVTDEAAELYAQAERNRRYARDDGNAAGAAEVRLNALQRLSQSGSPAAAEEAQRLNERLGSLRSAYLTDFDRAMTLDAGSSERRALDSELAQQRAQIAETERELQALGYSTRNTLGNVGRSFWGGAQSAAKGLVNELGYFGQGYAKGAALQNATANEIYAANLKTLSRIFPGIDRRLDEEAVRQVREMADALQSQPLESWAHWGDDYNAETARRTQFVSPAGRTVNQVAQGIGGMVPSIAANAIVPGSGLPVLFTQAAGNATEEALNAGADDARAMMYGAAVGGVEVLTEKMFGGIPGLGKGGLDAAVEGYIKRSVASPAAQRVWLSLVDALGEGLEEFASEVADEALSRRFLPRYDKRGFGELMGDAGYSALIGSLTGAAMNLPATTINAMRDMSPKQAAQVFADAMEQELSSGGNMQPGELSFHTGAENGGRLYTPEEYANRGQESPQTAPELRAGTDTPAPPNAAQARDLGAQQSETAAPEGTAGGRNTRLTEADLPEYLQTGERRHVRDAKDRQMQNGSPILTGVTAIRNFIHDSITGRIKDTIKGYGRVGRRLSGDVLAATDGSINIGDYYLELNSNQLAHLSDHVIEDKDARNIPLTEEQTLQLADYIDNYDDLIDVIRRKDGSVRLMLGKKINGHSIIIEAVSKGRKALHPVTAYQVDSERYERDYKQRAVGRSSTSRPANEGTVDISRPATTLNDDTISQTADPVKPGELSFHTGAENGGRLYTPEEYANRGQEGPQTAPELRTGTDTPAPPNAAQARDLGAQQSETAAPQGTAGPIHVGRATTIYHPYSGTIPMQAQASGRTVDISNDSLTRAESNIQRAQTDKSPGYGFKTALTRLYQQTFRRASGVPVQGLTFEGQQYLVEIGNKVPGKVISDPNLSTEKLALLDMLPQVVQNAEYVGSSEYIPKRKTNNSAIRYDYFETPVSIKGTNYIAKFDVEVIPSANNYRTHQIANVDLTTPEARLVGPAPTPSSGGSSPQIDDTIPQPANSVKPAPRDLSWGVELRTLPGSENAIETRRTVAEREAYEQALTDELADRDAEKYREETEAEELANRRAEREGMQMDSRPVPKTPRARVKLKQQLQEMFHIREGGKAAVNQIADAIADDIQRDGMISDAHLEHFFDVLYEHGSVLQQADSFFREFRGSVRGTKIYVSPEVRAEFGDDWNSFRRRAWGNGITLTNNIADQGVDVHAAELASIFGDRFLAHDTDLRAMLEDLVDTAERGKAQVLSNTELDDIIRGEYGDEAVREKMADVERRFRQALEQSVFENGADAGLRIAGHEWGHRIKALDAEAYGRFRDAVAEELAEQIRNKEYLYNEVNHLDYSAEELIEEAVNDYMGDMLRDGRILDEFIEAHRADKSLLRRMWEAVKKLAAKLTGAEKRRANSAEGKLRAALDAAAEAANNETAATEDGGRYSLKQFEDGTRFVDVQTDQAQFDGLTDVEKMNAARKIIKDRFSGKVIGIDNRAFVNGHTAENYSRPKGTMNPSALDGKMRASTELDNLIDAGRNFRNEPDGRDGHVHPDVTGGYDYFDTIFKVGEEYYSGIVNIENNAKGKRLKDITKIRNITKSIADSYGQSPKFSYLRDVSMDSIRDSTEKSKREFSLKSPDEATLTELRKQNERLREQLDRWKGQTRRTTEITLRQGDIDRAARELAKSYSATVKPAEIAPRLKALGEYIARGGDGDETITWQGVKDRAVEIARELVDSASALQEGDAGTYREIRDALRAPLTISAQDAHDISPEWGRWRAANRKNINISINGDGTPVDVAYLQLSQSYPALFPEDVTHPADQVAQMLDVLEGLAPVYENPFSYDMAEAVEYCANDIIDAVLSEDVRKAPPTFADRAAERLENEKTRGRERTDRLRAEKNAQIADLRQRNAWAAAQAVARERAKRDRQIAALKEHYRETREAKAERRADSAARTKLLKIARRLKNKKLPAANRALIQQYIGDLDTVSKSLTEQSIQRLSDLRDWYLDRKENDPDFISDPATEKKLERLSKTQIADLTSLQVRELTEVLQNIENELRAKNKTLNDEDRRDTFRQGAQIIADLENAKGSRPGGAGGALDRYIVTETLSPVRQVRRMTGYAEGDPLIRLTNALADGQRKMFDFQRRAGENFKRFAQDGRFRKRIAGKDAEEIAISGVGKDGPATVKITPAMRMSLYLHSLNDQNLKHIAGGGVTVPDMKLYKQGRTAEAYARGTTVRLTPSEVRRIAEGMSAHERAFANAAHDYFNGMSQREINEVSEQLKGYSLAEVENYFPINTDTSFTKKDFEALKFDGTVEGMGFLKERVNSASPIMLRDMNDVLTQSINNTAKYVGLAIPVRNFNKVWGVTKASFDADGNRNGYESSVQQAVKQKWGEAGYRYIEKMMTDLQSSGGSAGQWDKLFGKLRSSYAGAVLTLNGSVAMKQAASYPTAGAVVGFKPLLRAMADFGKVDLDLIAKYTPLQWYRSQGFSTQELGDMARRGAQLPKALNWIQGADLLTTRKLWKAAEYYVRQNNKDLNAGTDAYYREVADVYNRIIEDTQPNYTTMQRPQLLRSDSTLLQNLAMFKTQPFQNFNILYDAYGELAARRAAYVNATAERKAEAGTAYREAQKKALWAAESQLMQLAVFAGMTFVWNMFRGKRDKYEGEDGEQTLLSSLKGIGKDMLGGAASVVPFGSDVWELASSFAFGDRYYGFDAVTPSSINDFVNAIIKGEKVLKSVFSGEKTNWNEQRIKLDSILDATSKGFGIPYENVANLFNAVFRIAARAAEGEYRGNYAYLRLTTSPASYANDYYDNLFDAYRNDTEAYRQIYDAMLESGDFEAEKIKTAMENRMKKEQGVSKVSELERRWLSPEQEARYDGIRSELEGSGLWEQATEEQRGAADAALYSLTTGGSEGDKLREKIDGGKSVGLDETEYVLYLLARSMTDQPTESGKYGSYTNDEIEAAIRMIPGLSREEQSYLWTAQGKSEKNDPFA